MGEKNEKGNGGGNGGPDKDFSVVINGQEFTVRGPTITFQQLFDLANDGSWDANTSLTITYTRGHGDKPEGTLTTGESVKLKDRMIFDVDPTGKS